MVVLGLDSEVLEYRVGPEAFHEILQHVNILASYLIPSIAYPVVDLTVPDGVVDAISRASCGGESFVADVEVQVFGATFP